MKTLHSPHTPDSRHRGVSEDLHWDCRLYGADIATGWRQRSVPRHHTLPSKSEPLLASPWVSRLTETSTVLYQSLPVLPKSCLTL